MKREGWSKGITSHGENGSAEPHPKTRSSQPSAFSPTQVNSRFIYHHSITLTTKASAQQPRLAHHSTTPRLVSLCLCTYYPLPEVFVHSIPTRQIPMSLPAGSGPLVVAWTIKSLTPFSAPTAACAPKPSLGPDLPR